jgi:hypothetical protein
MMQGSIMQNAGNTLPRISFPGVLRICVVGTGGVLLIMAVLFGPGAVSLCSAESHTDGSSLYRKHCLACHPRALKALTYEDLRASVRQPPMGMPAFSEEKLSDLELRSIGESLFPAVPKDRKASQLEAARTDPPAAAIDTEPAVQASVPAVSGAERLPGSRSTAKEKREWLRSFGTQ